MDKLNKANYVAHSINLLANVARRVEKLVVSHVVALTFLQELINNLEGKVKAAESKIDAEQVWIEKETENRLAGKLGTLEAKVLKLEQEKETLQLDVDTSRQ